MNRHPNCIRSSTRMRWSYNSRIFISCSVSALFYFLLFLPHIGYTQPYKAVPVSVAEGLSQSSVYDIVQDQKGFTWIATQDGLNRYDGTSFEVFREEPFDTTSISSNNIPSLLCDMQGRLWVGSINHGLNLYVPEKGGFRHFKADGQKGSIESNFITALYQDPLGNIWVGTGSGLFRMKENGSDFTFDKIPLVIDASDTVPDKYVNAIVTDHRGNLWVGTFNGLFRFTVAPDRATVTGWFSQKNNRLSDKIAFALTVDNHGNLWVAGKQGLDILINNAERTYSVTSKDGLDGEYISALFTASNGDVWIGYMDRGVQVVRAFNNNAIEQKVVVESVISTPALQVLRFGSAISFWEDKITKGMIWTGFNAAGLVRLVPVTKHFVTNHLSDSPLESPFVTSLVRDPDGSVWIGTSTGLLNYNPVTNSYLTFQPSEFLRNKNEANYITGIAIKDDRIFVASHSDMFEIRKKDKKLNAIRIPVSSMVEGNHLRNLSNDPNGRIIAVLRYRIFEYDPDNNSFKLLVKINDQKKLTDRAFYLSCYFADASGNHWVGSSTGLEYYPAKSDPTSALPATFGHMPSDTNSLRNQNILCIATDRSGNLWTGTMNGLSRIDRTSGRVKFVNFSSRNGLKNNVIYSILNDPRTGNLWVSTNNGLTEFSPLGFAVATYDLHDGLQSSEFNSYAAFQALDGELYFGGINGYSSFYPVKIMRDTTAPVVNISSITLNGNRIVNLAELQKSKSIDLKYKDNSFAISFIGLHYVDPQKNQYAYRLEGFQDDWTYAGTTKQVNFSQLPPGKYIFRVKASNSDGQYSSMSDLFTININPPFHKTIWFYLLIALFIAAVLWGLHKYRLSMKLEQVREVEKIRRATAADFHDELGHKLTIISWFAEILKKKIGPEQLELRPHLDRIIEASGTLYHTMKDMLWAMDPDKDSVYDLYQQIREFGLELFDNTGVLFEADNISDELKDRIISPAHKRHVLLIFKEVMHNSLKHAHGTLTHFDLSRENGHLKFRFRDNGEGFKMNGGPVGHGLNNVKRRAGLINASINIKSEGTGTVAELDLPVENLN